MTKTFLRYFYLVLLVFPMVLKSQTETTRIGNIYNEKLGNGLSALFTNNSSGNEVTISLHVKTGSVYDLDSTSGTSNILQHIIASKIIDHLQTAKGTLHSQNTKFTSFTATDHSVFKLTTNISNIAAGFLLLREAIFKTKISNADVQKAIYEVLEEIRMDSVNSKNQFIQRSLQLLYRKEYEKLNIVGNPAEFQNINQNSLSVFYNRYYVTNNSLMAVTGNLTYPVFHQQLETVFGSLIKSEFDPESITKFVDFRPLVYTTHFVQEAEVSNPEFNLCWQFPGTSNQQESSYSAYLISAILNDKNNFIQVKAAKLGCKKFSAQYEANNYNGVLRIVLQPDKKNMEATLDLVTKEMARLENTLINETMINAGKLQFKKEFESLKSSDDYIEWIVRYWTYKEESYFTGLLDTVMGVTEKSIMRFTVDYLSRQPHITGLLISSADRKELNTDLFFSDVNQHLDQYVFRYRPNITDLEKPNDSVQLRNLLQFMKANSDINLQINGLADEGEYNQAADDSILMFIDSLPTFKRTMPQKARKGFLRPEMMRAMKVLKYFYDNGIDPERLSGTSMKFSSSTNEEAAENMKCTITIEKLRKAPSAYEFHYGKPRKE